MQTPYLTSQNHAFNSPSSHPSSALSPPSTTSPITLQSFQVKRELHKLKQGNAAGPDGIPSDFSRPAPVSCVTSSHTTHQGTGLSPFLFTIYASGIQSKPVTCFLQKFSDYSEVVSCIRGGRKEVYRRMIVDFVDWLNIINFSLTSPKLMVIHFRMRQAPTPPLTTEVIEVEVVSYRYLAVQMDDKLDWSNHMEVGQSRLYFLRRLKSFNICRPLLCTFDQTVVTSALFFGIMCCRKGLP